MKSLFIRVTGSKNREIIVNIEHITYYYRVQNGSDILLSNGRSLEVAQTPEQICELISQACFAMMS